MATGPRAQHALRVSGADVANAKVLMVGAGGIGCELVKNLVLCGFRDIEAIDLDTIDYSNLNRQFLFRAVHVNRPKVEVARETVLSFPHDEGTSIVAHHGNVKTPNFDLDYFGKFAIVLNALDNVDARRHVNRLCLAAGVPLIESGTEGYLGQVTVIKKGESECYECQPKSDNKKTYPICTVRNHPDKPVHCIAWAKELLFKKVFGGEETDLVDNSEAAPASDGADEAHAAGAPAPAAKLEMQPGETARAFAARVFDTVFAADVRRLLSMSTLWKERTPPVPLDFAALVPDLDGLDVGSPEEDQVAWSVAQSAAAFVGALVRAFETRGLKAGELAFDKDDAECLDFVAAASNLRSAIFGIPLQSRFHIKEIAGNIIPAIATTNAIIAGYIALEALKVLKAGGSVQGCASAFLCRTLSGKRKDRMVVSARLLPPAPHCFVCGTASVTVELDLRTATGLLLVKEVLCKKLSFHEPNLREGERGLYECGDLDEDEVVREEAKLSKLLSEAPFSLRHGSILNIDDQSQSLNCQLIISHAEIDGEAHPLGFVVRGALTPAAASGSAGPSGAGPSAAAAAEGDDDDFEIVSGPVTNGSSAGKKARKE